jgi:hypothetical protein
MRIAEDLLPGSRSNLPLANIKEKPGQTMESVAGLKQVSH